jgi:hypothetical protein
MILHRLLAKGAIQLAIGTGACDCKDFIITALGHCGSIQTLLPTVRDELELASAKGKPRPSKKLRKSRRAT